MAPPSDDHGSAMVEAVRDMVIRLEEHKRAGEESRQVLRGELTELVASMRADVHKSLASLSLHQADHKLAHEADRMERIARQQQLDAALNSIRRWLMVGLIGIALGVGFAVGIRLAPLFG